MAVTTPVQIRERTCVVPWVVSVFLNTSTHIGIIRLVVEYIVAIDVIRVRPPANAI